MFLSIVSIYFAQLLDLSNPIGMVISILIALGILIIGTIIGKQLIRLLGIVAGNSGELIVLASALGIGVVAYLFLALGIIGLLIAPVIWSLLGILAIWTWRKIRGLRVSWQKLWMTGRPENLFEQIGATLVLVMIIIVFLRGLAPVTDYDGLAYHLVVPREYLKAARIIPVPGEAHANFPLLIDLLFIPGITLGLENTARLIHWIFGILMGFGVFTLTRRITGSRHAGWLALFIFATTPVIGTIGGYAHTDLGWALFEFLAVYAIICWSENYECNWLILAGIFAGLGLGSKYLGLPVLAILGLAVLIQSKLYVRKSWSTIVRDGAIFGLVALIVGSPWYLKNWIWLGNPFYPLWFGGREWDIFLSYKLEFMGKNYGPRRGIMGLLLLPWDIFRYSVGYFGPIPFTFPTPLTFLMPLYIFVRKNRMINLILMIAILRFGIWALSARNTRYLIDLYPLLSIAVAYLLLEISHRRQVRVFIQVIVLGLLIINLIWQLMLLVQENPIRVILGIQDREAYLTEYNYPSYSIITYLNRLPEGSSVMFIGNGQSYYTTTEHISDVNHSNWGHMLFQFGEIPSELHQQLLNQNISHIYFSGIDFEWQSNFDFDGHLSKELTVFEEFVNRCALLVFDMKIDGQVFQLLDKCK